MTTKRVRPGDLPPMVRQLVMCGWHAVVFRGMQVRGVFPQIEFARGYVGDVADPEDRHEYQIVSYPEE